MTWTAPAVDRTEAELVAPERASLDQWLDYHRQTLLVKCTGLTAEQLRARPVPPSTLSLQGIVRHMTDVERWWFRIHAAGEQVELVYTTDEDPMLDFDPPADADAAADLAAYVAEIEACRAAVSATSLDKVVTCGPEHPHRHHERDVRWIYVHMIEEYARHNGHADLLREATDGATGE